MRPPLGRMMALASLDPVLVLGDREIELGTHQWASGTVAPQAASKRARIASSSMSWKPGRCAGMAPMSPPPCTLFCPRSGLSPEP